MSKLVKKVSEISLWSKFSYICALKKSSRFEEKVHGILCVNIVVYMCAE